MQNDNPDNGQPDQKLAQPTLPPAPSQPTEPSPYQSVPTEQSPLSGPIPPVDVQASQKPKRRKREGGVLSFMATILVALVLVQVINLFLFQSYRVVGGSMLPTLHEGDLLIISKVGKTSARIQSQTYEPSRNDIIVFQSPKDDIQLVKRVIGLPGERVVVKAGKITVYNDEKPRGFNPDDNTDYKATLPTTSGNADITIPDDHIFVSGDNREGGNSLDSRNELGTIPQEKVVGKLSVRLWPLTDARFF